MPVNIALQHFRNRMTNPGTEGFSQVRYLNFELAVNYLYLIVLEMKIVLFAKFKDL